MKWALRLGMLAAALIALVPAAAGSVPVQFAAPAGALPVERLHGAPFDAVLPSGRIVTPAGSSVLTGIGALGFALSPDGRFAIVSNDHALVVVDTATVQVIDRIAPLGETYFAGIVAVVDPLAPNRTLVFAAGGASGRVYVFDLGVDGRLALDARHAILVPPRPPVSALVPAAPVAATLVAAPDGRRVFVVDSGTGGVTAIATATRAVGATCPVGFAPFGAAFADGELLVANEGLMRYAPAASAALIPPFASPPPDRLRASSLSFVRLGPDGDIAPQPIPAAALAMDPPPDGLLTVGGAHPSALAVTPDGAYAFVAMTNVDRIATVRLGPQPQVVGGTELRLFDRGPYGTQPTALALRRDGTRLYVTLAGLNAVAVLDARDPRHLHRLGLIPTGWEPTALALADDDRTLYVVNTNGFGHERDAAAPANGSTLQKIDLSTLSLSAATLQTLGDTRTTRRSAPVYPAALRNVVVILIAGATFDALFGDLGSGPADPAALRFGAAITPNLHALARRFALAGNLFADDGDADRTHQFISGGITTAFAERRREWDVPGDLPPDGGSDPDDYPRAGYIYHDLARHAVSFRDYGDGLELAGYDDGGAPDPRSDDPRFAGSADRRAPTVGLGGRYTTDVPAPAILRGHVDLNYPGWNARIRDERRAREFLRDYARLVAATGQPRYTQIWLPVARTDEPTLPPEAERVADGDRALGTVVAYFTRLRSWSHTAIFIVPDGTAAGRDHVDPSRSFAVVVSPFARPGYVGMQHLSTVSVLKTAETILHLPPLALGDLLATEMSDFFTQRADPRPFVALAVPVQPAQAGTGTSGRMPNLNP